jgi:nucleoside-diphosphate-sugar epimerase
VSKLFIFGLGFCGREFAKRQRQQGWQVAATVRPLHQRDDLFGFDRSHPLDPAALTGATHLLASVPPDGEGDPVLDWLLRNGPWPALQWVGYLSTTGVYGDHQGALVNEQSPLNAAGGRSARRLEAERQWLESGLPVHIFRLAGIYGPGRSPLDSVRNGTAHRVIKPGQLFGRIHVEDVASVLAASINHPNPGAIYNVSDDEPAAPWEVVEYACNLLGLAPPPPIAWEDAQDHLSPMALSFYLDNKRVDNRRIKEELKVTLAYPNFRQGLQALLQDRL